MSPAARSVFAFGVYLGAGGIGLMFLPHRLCETFGLRPPGETLWARVCGALLVDLAHYCIRAARNEQIRFIRWTVPPRLLTLPILGVVVASGLENASILVFGVIDALAALWTLFALPGNCGLTSRLSGFERAKAECSQLDVEPVEMPSSQAAFSRAQRQ
jgi:hypothetical protein